MCASARSDGGRGDERRGEGVTEGERGERGGRVREGKKRGWRSTWESVSHV